MSKNVNFEDCFLLMLITLVFLFGFVTTIKKQDLVSKNEGRQLATFSHFSLDSFVDGSFQNNMEQALADQFVGSEDIKANYSYAFSHLSLFDVESSLCKNRYLKLASPDRSRAIFDCNDYILYMPEQLDKERKAIIEENIKKYNQVNKKIDTYYYLVDDASSFDFASNERKNDYLGLIRSQLTNAKGIRRLEYETYEEYQDFYYKTDHHWNYKGSYQGIVDISKMMGVEAPLHNGVKSNNDLFYGSNARMTNNFDYSEVFNYYDYDIRQHSTFINGKEGSYNNYYAYENHNYDYFKAMNLYAFVYGNDFGEVVFDYNQPKKDNLLIISDSFGNAINEIIAQNYNKTFSVDLRYYEETFGKEFQLSDYIKKNHIDKLLFIMSPISIWSRDANRGLES